MTLLQKIKLSLRITTTAFDSEITDLISAAVADLQLAGINGDTVVTDTTDPLVIQAIVAYCKWRFGEPENASQMKELYELQKAQLQTATGYTNWGANNG